MTDLSKWKIFLDSGLLWWVNRQLHFFGWVIVLDEDDEGNIIGVSPMETCYRGFDPSLEEEGFEKLTKFVEENLSQMKEDVGLPYLPLPQAPEWLEKRVTEAVNKARASQRKISLKKE